MVKRSAAALLCMLVPAVLGGCVKSSTPASPSDSVSITESAPSYEVEMKQFDCNPLTGAAKGENYNEKLRPTAVMVDNSREALPQSGLTAADVIYEMVTEGGITRLMAVFTDYNSVPGTGPVRSTRDQFVQFALPGNYMLAHIGTSIYASDLLRSYGYKTIDGIYLGTTAFLFDQGRFDQTHHSEHCFYTTGELLNAGFWAKDIVMEGGTNQLFDFVHYDQPAAVPAAGHAADIAFSYSEYTDARFVYNAGEQVYYKSEYGDAQMDSVSGLQLSFTNVVLMACDVTLKSDGLCTDFDLSSGTGYYFSQGGWQPLTWSKEGAGAPVVWRAADGGKLPVNTGKSYIGVVDAQWLAKTLTLDGTPAAQVAADSSASSSASGSNSQPA